MSGMSLLHQRPRSPWSSWTQPGSSPRASNLPRAPARTPRSAPAASWLWCLATRPAKATQFTRPSVVRPVSVSVRSVSESVVCLFFFRPRAPVCTCPARHDPRSSLRRHVQSVRLGPWAVVSPQCGCFSQRQYGQALETARAQGSLTRHRSSCPTSCRPPPLRRGAECQASPA